MYNSYIKLTKEKQNFMQGKRQYNHIPTVLTENEFNEFVLPYLKKGSRGPSKKISFFKLFNYILKLMHTGCQWSQIPIDKNANGQAEIHYTTIFKTFSYWSKHGCFDKIFVASVARLFKNHMLDISVLHGDGTSTAAKKGVII
jgi:transposase